MKSVLTVIFSPLTISSPECNRLLCWKMSTRPCNGLTSMKFFMLGLQNLVAPPRKSGLFPKYNCRVRNERSESSGVLYCPSQCIRKYSSGPYLRNRSRSLSLSTLINTCAQESGQQPLPLHLPLSSSHPITTNRPPLDTLTSTYNVRPLSLHEPLHALKYPVGSLPIVAEYPPAITNVRDDLLAPAPDVDHCGGPGLAGSGLGETEKVEAFGGSKDVVDDHGEARGVFGERGGGEIYGVGGGGGCGGGWLHFGYCR